MMMLTEPGAACFQSTLPHGERRLLNLSMIYLVYKLSIHTPSRGATVGSQGDTLRSVVFQSTLPHGERR